MENKIKLNVEMEKQIKNYNRVKMDLLKISKCIECCESQSEKEVYQDAAMGLSKELKRIYECLEKAYDIKICGCCKTE